MYKHYWCAVCTYFYIPEEGDPQNGIEPGTEFDDLPDDWCCPICFNPKNNFVYGS